MFPGHFLWGAATSSHQVEGRNTNNDWWLWEKQGRTKEPSGEAARHFELFDEDFRLAAALHHNAHRFSIEWSRIEPQEGVFDEGAVHHYREVVRSLRRKSLEPIVTLHHFTNPLWFYEQGGWLNKRAVFWFRRYAAKMVDAVGKDVAYWMTINEPMVFVYHSYLIGLWPPGEKSVAHSWQATQNLIQAHKAAYQAVQEIYGRNSWPSPHVSIAQNLRPFHVCPMTDTRGLHLSAFLRHRLFNLYFLDKIKEEMDFIGVNYYEREIVSNDKDLAYGLFGGKCNTAHGHEDHVNSLGWGSYPQGLHEILLWLKKYRKPVLISENGTCEEDDTYRTQFIKAHLEHLERAIGDGVPVIGYLYWSLLDNFEWHHGFSPRFGLIEVDYATFKRTIRPSARYFADVIQKGRL
jgi:beta-glucosidase